MNIDVQAIKRKSFALQPWLTTLRRDFHKYPELGMEEFQTRKKIIEVLNNMNIKVIDQLHEIGVVGIIGENKNGPTVALRADMDALPIKEDNEVPYKSKNPGIMHACGHDAHMAIVLGAACLLKEIEAQLPGPVKLIFQPAEETFGGAKPLINAGALKNPSVDAIFGLHVSPFFQTGRIGLKHGQMNAASDTIEITVKGTSGHGAYPHKSTDAIAVSAQLISALQNIVSRQINPLHAAVISFGTINGGSQENITADRVTLKGTVRTLDSQTREKVIHCIENHVQSIPESFGAKGEMNRYKGYPPLNNDEESVEIVKKAAQSILKRENVITIQEPSMGVEDFAYYLKETKGAFFLLGCGQLGKSNYFPPHHEKFDIDENCLPLGVALQTHNVCLFMDSF